MDCRKLFAVRKVTQASHPRYALFTKLRLYGFLVSPEAGGQLSPAKGLSGLTRGEQCCTSGAAGADESFEVAGGEDGSLEKDWRGSIDDAEGGTTVSGRSGRGADGESTGGVKPPGGEGEGVVTTAQPCFPFGWSVRMVVPLVPSQR